MHDKQIRRRRAVLVLLVAISLILLTDYFGESPSSPLHSVQRGVADVLSPVQDGASKVFSPVRDVAGWISSTVDAKSKNKQLEQEVASLQSQVAHSQLDETQYATDQGLLHLDNVDDMKQYDPVAATVIAKDPIAWYDTITVNAGAGAGVKAGQPVIGDGGLVGVVSRAGDGWSLVTLITSPKFSVAAMVENGPGNWGMLQPQAGDPSTLQLNYLPTNAQVSYGDEIVTASFKDSTLGPDASLYPAGIPIGTVSNENTQDSVLDNQQVQVHPSVDLQNLTTVQILTNPQGHK